MSNDTWPNFTFVVSIIIAGFIGFKAGQYTKHSIETSPTTSAHSKKHDRHEEDSSDEEGRADGDLSSVQTRGPCKMVSKRVEFYKKKFK